jgi:hypothetical protein
MDKNIILISKRTFEERINQCLAERDLRLCPGRSMDGYEGYYLLEKNRDVIIRQIPNMVCLGEELGCLKPNEKIEG